MPHVLNIAYNIHYTIQCHDMLHQRLLLSDIWCYTHNGITIVSFPGLTWYFLSCYLSKPIQWYDDHVLSMFYLLVAEIMGEYKKVKKNQNQRYFEKLRQDPSRYERFRQKQTEYRQRIKERREQMMFKERPT